MLKNILPNKVYNAIFGSVNFSDVYEIRLRVNNPISINLKNHNRYVTETGISINNKDAIICTKELIESVVFKASSQSIYAFNEQIKKGFITVAGGIRIGITGQVVLENKKIKTIKYFSSLNIRIPHEVMGCSKEVLTYLMEGNSLYNTLIISPPGAGKTTFLRDLAYQINLISPNINLLILDERMEIAGSCEGVNQLMVGSSDVFSGVSKSYGFESGIRSMNPQIIFTDEIANLNDVEAIEYAGGCGVRVVASTHGYNLETLKIKSHFLKLLDLKVFDRFVVLSKEKGAGTLDGVYDSNFKLLT